MALHSGLALYAYNLATAARTEYAESLMDLSFSTTSMGGWGDLKATLMVNDPRNVPSELTLFSNVAVIDPSGPSYNTATGSVWQGRWDEPGIALDQTNGPEYSLSALGAADVLKDEPSDASYVNTTAQTVIGTEIANRSAYLVLDQDTSQILPDNPTAQFNPSFNGKTLQDMLNELCPLLGDYVWAVWDHPKNKDTAGFPTWQLYWHVRDASTIAYTGYYENEDSYNVRPAVEYSYNAVKILYRDATTNAPSSVTVTDSRLAANKSQGSAPFPYRLLRKDLSGYKLTATEASSIANALLSQYQNGGFKITVVLTTLLDANGNPIPLWACRADRNIFLPQLAPIGQQLATSPTKNTNLFYITETRYDESAGSTPQLTLTCDSFYDTASFQIARLQYAQDQVAANGKWQEVVRASGSQISGSWGVQWGGSAVTTDTYSSTVNYGQTLSNIPTSITITVSSSTNAKTPSVDQRTLTGFRVSVQPNANGAGNSVGTFTTVGA